MTKGFSIVFPTRSVADKKFRYRDKDNTDVARTFERFRRLDRWRARRAAAPAPVPARAPTRPSNVVQLPLSREGLWGTWR